MMRFFLKIFVVAACLGGVGASTVRDDALHHTQAEEEEGAIAAASRTASVSARATMRASGAAAE